MDNNTLEFLKVLIPAIGTIIVAAIAIIKNTNSRIDKSRDIERELWREAIENEKEERKKALSDLTTARETIETNQHEITELQTALVRAEEGLRQLPDLTKRVSQLEEKVKVLEADNGKLKEENEQLKCENSKLKITVAAYHEAFSLMNRSPLEEQTNE